ncbi:MAG: hypothetical protein OXN27_22800 [Candidatus Poribacteria bacterium]|nr:hypothetical protein [Candidatus Poribacteria bacterium]
MDSKEMFDVLQRVKTWKPEMRIDLARRILETIVSPRPPLPPQTMTLEEVQAIMKTDKLPPTDGECKKILEEERMKKYGTPSLEETDMAGKPLIFSHTA